MTDLETLTLAWVTGQLRHAYQQLVGGYVHDTQEFAKGLIAPQIRLLESLITPGAEKR